MSMTKKQDEERSILIDDTRINTNKGEFNK